MDNNNKNDMSAYSKHQMARVVVATSRAMVRGYRRWADS
jgi:hypothetical protein